MNTRNTRADDLDPNEVISAFESESDLARQLDITQQAVNKWKRAWEKWRRPVPKRHHIRIARLRPRKFGYLISRK